MEIIFISLTAIVSLLTLLLGVRVYFAKREAVINKSFAIFSVITFFWLLLDFATYRQDLENLQTFFYKTIFAVIIMMVFALAYFINYFPKTYLKLQSWSKIILFGVVALLVLMSLFTAGIVDYAFMEKYGANFVQGKYFTAFIIYVSILSLFIIIALVNKYIRAEVHEKKQIKYLLYGLGLFIFMNLVFNMLVPLVTNSFVYGRLGTYSSLFFVGFLAYAILKAQLFNLKVILTESAVVIIDVLMVVQIFTAQSAMEGLLRALFAVLIFYGSYMLLASVKREIKFREELQQLTEQLAHANAHLKELDQMKTEFVSLASHELLTPVSAIEGYLSMMLDEHMGKVDDPKAKKYLERVSSSAKRLARLVADMLNISRIEEGRLLVEKKDIDLSDLINQVIDEIKFKAEDNKQTIIFDDGKSEIRNPKSETNSNVQNQKFETFGDPDKIKEVIVNLIGNSIKYSKNPGTINIHVEKVPTSWVAEKWQRVESEIKARPLDDQEAIKSAVDPHSRDLVGSQQILIAVQDQGIGIPKEELPRLFKKFHRVGDFSTAESQGTGLGLYISRALVELHHGRIWADSEGPSHGSTFTFSLPDISDKQALLNLEAQAPKQKEALKPLARPMKSSEDI